MPDAPATTRKRRPPASQPSVLGRFLSGGLGAGALGAAGYSGYSAYNNVAPSWLDLGSNIAGRANAMSPAAARGLLLDDSAAGARLRDTSFADSTRAEPGDALVKGWTGPVGLAHSALTGSPYEHVGLDLGWASPAHGRSIINFPETRPRPAEDLRPYVRIRSATPPTDPAATAADILDPNPKRDYDPAAGFGTGIREVVPELKPLGLGTLGAGLRWAAGTELGQRFLTEHAPPGWARNLAAGGCEGDTCSTRAVRSVAAGGGHLPGGDQASPADIVRDARPEDVAALSLPPDSRTPQYLRQQDAARWGPLAMRALPLAALGGLGAYGLYRALRPSRKKRARVGKAASDREKTMSLYRFCKSARPTQLAFYDTAPVGDSPRRLSQDEERRVEEGKSQLIPKLFPSYGTRPEEMMSSPWKGGLAAALGTASVGAGLGALFGSGPNFDRNPSRGAAVGAGLGALAGIPVGALTGLHRRQQNENLTDLMRRTSPGATRRDFLADPVYYQDQTMRPADPSAGSNLALGAVLGSSFNRGG